MEYLANHPAVWIGGVFFVGLMVGSFLNVLILRYPKMLNYQWRLQAREILELNPDAEDTKPPGLLLERSHCPQCQKPIPGWHNIPIISYMLLRGRCAKCKTPISWQYPFVELITGLAAAAVAWKMAPGWDAVIMLIFTFALVGMSGIDMRTKLLPDSLTLPMVWLGLVAGAAGFFVGAEQAIWGAVAGYLSLWSVYHLFRLLTGKHGMGHGDFKLLAAIGAFGGLSVLPITILLSSVVGIVIGSISLKLQNADSQTTIPFGPYLAIAGWIALLWGDWIIDTYWRLSGMP